MSTALYLLYNAMYKQQNCIPLLLTASSTSSSSDMNKFDGDLSGVSGSNNSSSDWLPDSSPAGCYKETFLLRKINNTSNDIIFASRLLCKKLCASRKYP